MSPPSPQTRRLLTRIVHDDIVSHTHAATQYTLATALGLYLGAGQHLIYTGATVAVALVATVLARRSTARAAHVATTSADSANRAEPVQSVAVTGVVEDDLDCHVDGDFVGFTLDDVRHHAGTLV